MRGKVLDLFTTYRRSSKDELGRLANDAMCYLKDAIKYEINCDDKKAISIVLAIYSKFAGKDGVIKDWEVQLLEKILRNNQSNDTYSEYANFLRNQSDALNDETIRSLCRRNRTICDSILKLGLAVCAIDGTISISEEDFLDYISD